MNHYIIPKWPVPKHINACITTRFGGVSKSPFDENNMALHVNDNMDDCLANRRNLTKTLALPKICWLQQNHGTTIYRATNNLPLNPPQADASITDAKIALAVLSADCLPILICDKNSTRIAAIHAGWRGLANGIIRKVISQFDSNNSELMVWLGPAIGPQAFTVGEEVYQIFLTRLSSFINHNLIDHAFTLSNDNKYHANLYRLAQLELNYLGIQQIYGGDCCTYYDQRFYSYRRNQITGRFASIIWQS